MKREELKEYFRILYSGDSDPKLLREQEEDEDLFGDDEEAGDDEGEADAEEEGGEAEKEGGGEDKESDAEEEEDIPIEAGDEVRLGKQFDIALDSLLQDYEVNALKSAQIHAKKTEEIMDDSTVQEWSKRGLSDVLFEQQEVFTENDIDIELFSSDVARLINNYDSLMDMESIIFNKAKEFLMIKYGQDVADAFAEILRIKFNLDFDSEISALEDIEVAAPLAVGASGGEGA